jgi:hypothetical protein
MNRRERSDDISGCQNYFSAYGVKPAHDDLLVWRPKSELLFDPMIYRGTVVVKDRGVIW